MVSSSDCEGFLARRSVAVVGSSGGSSLLMTNPTELLLAINEQLASIRNGRTERSQENLVTPVLQLGARIVAAQIVCCAWAASL